MQINLLSWFKKVSKQLSLPFVHKKAPTLPLDLMEISRDDTVPWWGHFLVADQQSRYTKIGPIILCIDYYNQEWKFAIRQDSIYQEKNALGQPMKIIGSYLPQNEIRLKPILADRNLLVRLSYPLCIPPAGNLNIYVSSPAWIRIEIGHPPLLLEDIPTLILADTWSGDNTLAGELCYAGNGPISINPKSDEEISQDFTQVISPLLLQNFSKERVYVKELKIPLPFLSIYSDIQNHLWTEQILLSFENDQLPRTMITQGYPKNLENPSLLSSARIPVKARFKSFFSGGKNHS